MEDVALKSLFHSQDVKLSSFLQNCSKVFYFLIFYLKMTMGYGCVCIVYFKVHVHAHIQHIHEKGEL